MPKIISFFSKNGSGEDIASTRAYKIFYALLPVICGALTAVPFLAGGLWFISWFSLIPVIYRVFKYCHGENLRWSYRCGFLFGLGYFLVMYHWFINFYPMDFAGLNEVESVGVIALCWLGLATLQSIELGFVTLVYRLITPASAKPWRRVLSFTACWSVFEWSQTLGWRGVPWGRLALSQWKALPLIQSASLLGGVFVGAIMVAFGCVLAIGFISFREHRFGKVLRITASNESSNSAECKEKRDLLSVVCGIWERIGSGIGSSARACICIALGIFLLNFTFGIVRMAAYNETAGEPIKAVAIQGNISSLDKWADNSLYNSTKVHLELTRQAVEETGAELVLWAETAIPVTLDKYKSYKKQIAEVADEFDITLIVGTFETTLNPETEELDDRNALIVFLPDGTELETRYYKRHLVPFAESLPMEGFIRTFLPVLVELNLIRDPLWQGTDANVMETEIGNIGGIICYDSIFPALSVDAVRNGAELIAVSTNDSWFADSGALYQHNHQSAMRAIETGRYVLRSANTGISSIITPEGEYLDQLAPLQSGYVSADIYMRSDATLYVIVGDLFVYICLGFIAVSASAEILKKAYRNRDVER